jgi:hypothetical protein
MLSTPAPDVAQEGSIMKVLLAIVALTVMCLPLSTGHQDGGDLVNAVIGNSTPSSHYPNEQARIRAHLLTVARRLNVADASHMTTAQRDARAKNIARLVRYADAGRFPHNPASIAGRAPNFMDDEGNVCAVGYLVEQDKGLAAVREIARDHQYDYVPYIDSPVLAEWQTTSGLTPLELAMIQPTYCSGKPEGCSAAVAPDDSGISGQDVAVISMAAVDVVTSIFNFTYVMNGNGNQIWGGIGLFVGAVSIAFDQSLDDSSNYLTAAGIVSAALGATSFGMTLRGGVNGHEIALGPLMPGGSRLADIGLQARVRF